MTLFSDPQFIALLGGLFGIVALFSFVGVFLAWRTTTDKGREVVANFNARVKAWWVMTIIFVLAIIGGHTGTVLLFAVISFFALREYLALSPTIRDDHRVLIWLVFVMLPVNYILVAIQWYGLFVIFIPVYAFLWLQIRAAMSGATEGFLDRTARIQWGMMVTIYFVSYVPALLMLNVPAYSGSGQNYKLILFLVIVVQGSDTLQYMVGKLFGKHKIAPLVSPSKTVEGFIGGIALATLLGTSLYRITPFTPLQAAGLSLIICVMGFAGGLVMSATKRDRGVKDFGTLLPGHGGMMDRIDSLCFAAPIFFHVTRYFFM